MTDKEKILKGFEELNEIIEPYKNKRNYNKLCLRLRFWAKNFQIRLLWKKAPASEEIWEASKQYALRQVLASTDAEMSEQAYLDLRLFSGFELAVAHKDGAKWKEQKMMKDAYDAYVSYIRDNSEAVVHLKNTSITMSCHFPKRDLEEGDKLKIVIIKED